MAQNYRLDEVLLSFEDDEDVLEALLKQRGTLESFEYYNSNPKEIVDAIIKADDELKYKYIKGIVSIYPLSAGILKKLMESYTVQDMRDKVFEWLDVSDTIIGMVNKFITVCSEGIKESSEESELEEQLAILDTKKQGLEAQREKNRANKEKLKAKRIEVDAIKAECDELEQKYSPDVLKAEEEKYKKKKAKLDVDKKEYEKKIAALEAELKPYKKDGNDDFDKAIEAFSKVIKTLPHDEG